MKMKVNKRFSKAKAFFQIKLLRFLVCMHTLEVSSPSHTTSIPLILVEHYYNVFFFMKIFSVHINQP